MSYFNYKGQKVFYTATGSGEPCLFLHGNTASSKMFDFILPLYTNDLQVIRLDFLGNGKSDRVDAFPDELWIDQGRQVVELAKALNCGPLNLVGSSGGAYAAINAALAEPQLFRRVVADSFDGDALPPGFAQAIIQERQAAKQDEQARGFYEWNQGPDWEQVVDLDTDVLVRYEEKQTRLFLRPIAEISAPLLITISLEDEMLHNDAPTECARLHSRNPLIEYRIFEQGAHPLLTSRAEEIAELIKSFLQQP